MKNFRTSKPFIKWAGGKQQLLDQFEPLFPKVFTRYFEPFVGSGAVFFYLWNAGKLPAHIFLFDNNEELINAYLVVRDHVDDLIETLAKYKENHNRDHYYKVRDMDRQDVALSQGEKAARTIYLNKTCYNGLYRVNSKGQFNVPMGSYKNPGILDEQALRAANEALHNVCLERRDFRTLVETAERGDFFYFDPPYDPLSKTSSFTGYTAGSFNDIDQRDLAVIFTRLSEQGCLCMLSNSSTPFIFDLYKEFRIITVQATRAINSNPEGRGVINEIVVLNY